MRECEGFTLIELMVVVVIIGLLASIAIPNYVSMMDRAKEAKVKNNAHVVQLAVEDFAVVNGGIYSDAAGDLLPLLPDQANVENAFTRALSEPQFAADAATTGQIGVLTLQNATGTNVGYRITGMGKDPANGFVIALTSQF